MPSDDFDDDSAMEIASHRLSPKKLPITKLIPNIVTITGMCMGMSSIRFALVERWDMAVLFILLAGIIDGMDGRIARMLKATSDFGAQLDSLSDFLNFGIVPSLVLYLWKLKNIEVKGLGFAIALFFLVCCAIRLARFNISLDDGNKPAWSDAFFIGVPSPAGAALVVMPMMLSFELTGLFDFSAITIGIYSIFIASLMASRVPTFSFKKAAIKHEYASYLLIASGLLIISIILEPWYTIPIAGILYFLTLPFSYKVYNNLKNNELKKG